MSQAEISQPSLDKERVQVNTKLAENRRYFSNTQQYIKDVFPSHAYEIQAQAGLDSYCL